jgi:AcrR family transcriptional regulator
MHVSKMKKTKENIIQVAVLLLEEDKNCSLEQIATKAGVSRRTLHRYFDGKEELIIAVFETLADKYYKGVLEIIGVEKPIVETVKSLLSYDLKMFSSHSTVYYLYENFKDKYKFEEEDIEKVEEEFLRVFSKLTEKGHCNQSVDNQWINAYFDSLIHLGNSQMKNGIEHSIVEKTIWQLFWNGISK